ncbi:MAG: SDR family oxidoreductase [Acidimicrobiia bacterium]|nr:SDR family oxidoreductase [Acidimicrobiia bacterium]
MKTVVVTGSASGMGAATRKRLEGDGHTVIGVDLNNAEVNVDLGTEHGRVHAVDAVMQLGDGAIDGVVTFAGLAGTTSRPGSTVAAVNYFGTVAVLEGLRSALAAARGGEAAAVAISSNSSTVQPGLPGTLVEACLAGDEDEARRLGDELGAPVAYPSSKLAVARWVRRNAPQQPWAGAGITLNAVAPGYVETPMTAEIRRDETIGPLLDQFPIPVGRPGRPQEIAALVAFLLGPEARYLCGSVVLADGGSEAFLRPDHWPVAWRSPRSSATWE